jgi:hypothetical protein
MPKYTVPPRYVESFTQLANLDGEAFERLAAALEEAQPSLNPHTVWQAVSERSGLTLDFTDGVLEGILTAAALGGRDGLSPDANADALQVDRFEGDLTMFRARVARLLRADAIRTTVRALDLAVSEDRVVLRSRVLTDIRPIFPPEPVAGDSLAPIATLIHHSLRLEYLEDGETRTFSVSLDRMDIDKLRAALDRATKKERGLVELITAAGVRFLDVEGDDDE